MHIYNNQIICQPRMPKERLLVMILSDFKFGKYIFKHFKQEFSVWIIYLI